MIVRCKSCNSAFAVDDEKVSGKKFAYSCLKCGTENIVDNRADDLSQETDMSMFSDTDSDIRPGTEPEKFSGNSDAPAAAEDDIFFDESPFDTDETAATADDKKISADEDSDLFTDDELVSFEDEADTSGAKPAPDDDLIFDDFESSDISIEDGDFDDSPTPPAGKDEPKLTRQEDIDELFASIPDSKGDGDDETPLDLNEIDLEFEDSAPAGTEDEMIVFDEDDITIDDSDEKAAAEDDIDIDLAEIDIDFDESIDLEDAADTTEGIAIDLDDELSFSDTEETSPTGMDDVESAGSDDMDMDLGLDLDFDKDVKTDDDFEPDADMEQIDISPDELTSEAGDLEVTSDEDITLDLKELDIDLDESEVFGTDESISHEDMDESEEDLKLNLDELDIDLEEEIIAESDSMLLSDSPSDADEDLTLNLDELDIDIEDHIAPDSGSVLISDSSSDEEEDLTLNLNELDIDLEDEVIRSSLEKIDSSTSIDELEEDESITIDLDTLDIDVSEHEEAQDEYILDDEDKLTIDDAGLTFDELAEDLHIDENKGVIKKSIKDSLDEIDPEFELHAISDDSTAHERHIIETIDELPEIDLDEYEEFLSEKQPESSISQSMDHRKPADDINFDDIEIIPLDDELDIYTSDEDVSETYILDRGTTSLSIDFSLKYSRIGALLRLTGLYLLTLIPQFIVMLVYTVLSSILGFINQIVILFTGHCVEDFSQITENTLRYLVYIKTNITGIVEDRPVYSGRPNLNHQLQINITYPVKYSRNIALLRLSIIGIIIFILPHLLILALLSLAVPAAFIAGLIIVAATGRWPGILFTFLTKYFRYLTKVTAFAIGLNDEYPPFRFE